MPPRRTAAARRRKPQAAAPVEAADTAYPSELVAGFAADQGDDHRREESVRAA